MTLFMKQIAERLSGQVGISIPVSTGGYNTIVGFLSEDPVIKMGNKWESLVGDLGTVNDFMQVANQGAVSWIATSKMAWKGTDPISVTLNFYLITYLRAQVDGTGTNASMPVSKAASQLARLATIDEDLNATGFFKDARIKVHGGYTPNYFENNDGIFNNGNVSSFLSRFSRQKADDDVDVNGTTLNVTDDSAGTCHIVINGGDRNSVVLENMLLESLDMTPSTVRAGYWSGSTSNGDSMNSTFKTSSEPLYIKVNATFRLMRATTSADIAKLFGKNY